MRFLADANTGPTIMAVIADAGHEVVSARSLPPGKSDLDILRDAVDDKMIVVTADTDFGDLIFLHQLPALGVVLLRIRQPSERKRAAVLRRYWSEIEASLPGNFVTVREAGVRIRPIKA